MIRYVLIGVFTESVTVKCIIRYFLIGVFTEI